VNGDFASGESGGWLDAFDSGSGSHVRVQAYVPGRLVLTLIACTKSRLVSLRASKAMTPKDSRYKPAARASHRPMAA
jgi:hypothetical protein